MISITSNEIYEEINAALDSLGVNSISPLSPGNLFAERFSSYMSSIYGDISIIDEETDITNKSGDDLTSLASKYGIERTSTTPLGDDTFTNFNFYLKDDLRAKDITIDTTVGFTIPAGSVISNQDGTSVSTIDDANFGPDDNKIYVRIASNDITENASINVNDLVIHDVNLNELDNIDPNKVDTSTLLCTNDNSLVSNSETLSDDELKDLLRYNFNGLNDINENRVKLAVLSIAGVSDLKIIENYNGVGVTGIIIVPTQGIGSESLYRAVEDSLRKNVIGGENIIVIRPYYLSIYIKLSIELNEAVYDTDLLYNEIRVFTADYINSINQGDTFDPNDLEKKIQENYSNKVDIAQISCLYINTKRAMIQKQETFEDQKFILYNSDSDVVIN